MKGIAAVAVKLQLLIAVQLVHLAKVSADHQHTNIFIIGGTGDLAKKYLWNSALNLFVNQYNENNTFSFFAGARLPQEDGQKAFDEILTNVNCEQDDIECLKIRPKFVQNAYYATLKTPEQYEKLCKTLLLNIEGRGSLLKQIFYFSIPSSAYKSVAKMVHDHCRNEAVTSTTVVLEKPFGLDKTSASEQVEAIGRYFKDDEIQRVDHYLAKSVTKQILKFRSANKEKLEELLNSQYVDRVEIVMKELIGVKGRIDFYDQTGVVRDVIQNHLTELLALVAMDLPENVSRCDQVEDRRLSLLNQVQPLEKDGLIVGQYRNYITEAKEEIEDVSRSHFTPTFAAALLKINSQRWRNVPFLIVSGKHMDERSSFVRILFREKEYCVSGCLGSNTTFTKYPRQIVFQIGNGPVPSPGILVSRSLFEPTWPSEMRELSMTSKDSTIHGQSPGDFHYAVPTNDDPAYFTVLKDLYHNEHQTFVTSTRVLVLWNIWDKVIRESLNVVPKLYKEYDSENLNFVVSGYSLEYIEKSQSHFIHTEKLSATSSIRQTFRNGTLVCKEENNLIATLAEHLNFLANQAIKDRNTFHIAFSGGSSPIPLFSILATKYPLFPWPFTHIWQVDERCVSNKHEHSNFKSLHEHLLQHIQIPYFNIHPMPVNFAGKICDPTNKGDLLYEDLIEHTVMQQKLDVILLGLGSDGHTASVFPLSNSLAEIKRLVAFTNSKIGGGKDRMSLLPPFINKSREVIVLVTGKSKHEILHKISALSGKDKAYPITFIQPVDGNMTWYIDYEAWIDD